MITFSRDGNLIHINGEVTIPHVDARIFEDFLRLCDETVEAVDLAEVTHADSACIALIIAAQKKNQKHRMHILGASAGIRNLLDLYQLNECMDIS